MQSNYPQYTTKQYRNTNPNEIAIYKKGIIQDYEIIGPVGADVKGDSVAVINRIKKKASKLGADAIIHFKLNHVNVYEETGSSGVAIKLVEKEHVAYSLH
jgi:hypothetical protein